MSKNLQKQAQLVKLYTSTDKKMPGEQGKTGEPAKPLDPGEKHNKDTQRTHSPPNRRRAQELLANTRKKGYKTSTVLEHLIAADPADFLPTTLPDPDSDFPARSSFLPSADASPAQILDAQYQTSLLGEAAAKSDDIIAQAEKDSAKNAFLAMVGHCTDVQKKEALAKLDVPEAVKELVGMLTAYDWAFVEQAKELRGYAVAKILEETNHPDARLRLKALEMLGKVTEVALFTERSEVKQVGMSDSELDAELKKRLDAYLALEREVIESTAVKVGELGVDGV